MNPFLCIVRLVVSAEMTTIETARRVVLTVVGGSGAVAVVVGTKTMIAASDQTTTIMAPLPRAIMTVTVTGRVVVVAVAEEAIVAARRGALTGIGADIIRPVGKGHEVGISQHLFRRDHVVHFAKPNRCRLSPKRTAAV